MCLSMLLHLQTPATGVRFGSIVSYKNGWLIARVYTFYIEFVCFP